MITTHSPVTVRPVSPADYDDVARITRDSYLAAGHFDDAEHPYMIRIQQVADRAAAAPVWAAERDGKVVGSVTLAVAGDPYADIARGDELEFRMLVVDPAVQRGGIGRALVQAIIAHARTLNGINGISLTTGQNWHSAHALYESTGFVRVPERDWLVPETEIKLLVYRLDL
ncbi:GNAT family N-acetyltransferase [Paenarthrobacter sp. Z7-10]|nr:GNAT family N-acetyltransferase [Paenarthrobacter sp. Z7-10]